MYTNFGPNGWNIRNNGGLSRVFITDSGNVGIGTTVPAQKLDVAGNINASGNLTLTGTEAVPLIPLLRYDFLSPAQMVGAAFNSRQ